MNKHYKIIAKAIMTGEIGKIALPTESLDSKKISAVEVLNIVKEEFGKVQDLNTKKLPKEMHFKDADLAHQVDFVDALDLKEFLKK